MLTWSDILKLCVPFAFSLVTVWAKEWYVALREERFKKETLWRQIDEDCSELSLHIQELKSIAKAFAEKRARMSNIDVSEAASAVAVRLAELNPRNAHIYTSYAARLSILRKGLSVVGALIGTIVTRPSSENDLTIRVLRAQCETVAKDYVLMAKDAIRVLEVIKDRSGQRRFDRQVITRAQNNLDSALKILAFENSEARQHDKSV
jgi:transcriptional regulator NrdR family protein